MSNRLTLLTPSCARDLERFALQRESIRRCGIDLPHVALVNAEDAAAFEALPHQSNLRIVTTADVLPAKIEARRRAWRISRRDWRYWVTGKGISGWMAQQLLKLAAPEIVETESVLCLDSDTLFVRRVDDTDFHAADGRLHLYETDDDLDVEMAEWQAHSLRYLGLSTTGVPLARWTHSPVPLQCGVLKEMRDALQARHRKPWMEAIIDGSRITEYTTYGVYARYIDQLRRVKPHRPGLCVYYWWSAQAQTLGEDLARRVRDERGKMVLINSNIGRPVSAYRAAIESVWDEQAVLA